LYAIDAINGSESYPKNAWDEVRFLVDFRFLVLSLTPRFVLAAYVFLNKSHRASTYLNRPYKKRSKLLSLISEYHDPEEDRKTIGVVEMAPFPAGIDKNGRVEFDWDKCEKRGGSWKKVRERLENRSIEPK
jgi:dimethylaniline monooxygenase (N-oxide forming)